MKWFFVLIAVILAILFGMSVALDFLGALWIGAIVLLVVAGVFMAIMEFMKFKIWGGIKWLAAAAFFGWILSFCF